MEQKDMETYIIIYYDRKNQMKTLGVAFARN